jgi:hypothetical protein
MLDTTTNNQKNIEKITNLISKYLISLVGLMDQSGEKIHAPPSFSSAYKHKNLAKIVLFSFSIDDPGS